MVAIRVSASGVRLPDLLARWRKDADLVVQSGVRTATDGMLRDMRADLAKAFPGSTRAPTLVTGRVFPDRVAAASVNAAGSVIGRGGKNSAWPLPLIAFTEGRTIVPTRAGTALAIPTARVPRVGGRRLTPDEVSKRFGERLTLIRAKPGSAAWGFLVLRDVTEGAGGRVRRATKRRLAAGRERKPVVMFVLVPQVRLNKRLDFEGIARRWADTMPTLLDAAAGRIVGKGG